MRICVVPPSQLAEALSSGDHDVVFITGQEDLAQAWLDREGKESLLDTQRSLQPAYLPLAA